LCTLASNKIFLHSFQSLATNASFSFPLYLNPFLIRSSIFYVVLLFSLFLPQLL
jgi:hypothetical protein